MGFLPGRDRLERRWRIERTFAILPLVLMFIAAAMMVVLVGMMVFPALGWLALGLPVAWLVGAGCVVARFLRRPGDGDLAKRTDGVLGLPDDALALCELDSDSPWRAATERSAGDRLAEPSLRLGWRVRLPRACWAPFGVALGISLAIVVLSGFRLSDRARAVAEADAARADRLEAAAEVLEDWEQFAEETDSPELAKLFADAAGLREALAADDPMQAMIAMNRIEENVAALEESLEQASVAGHAGALADAMDAIGGLGALSAALRSGDFDAASREAEEAAARMANDPRGASDLRRGETIAEALASQAASAGDRGNGDFASPVATIGALAKKHAQEGKIPNDPLSKPTRALRDPFAQEAARQRQGRLLGMSRQQLDGLRARLRGEEEGNMPSLCEGAACMSGQTKAGTGSAGDPRGDETDLMPSATANQVTGVAGDGESESRTVTSATGAAAAAGAGRQATVSDYVELSRSAVADESLPLAHRRVIRTYFERIRPVAESTP